MNLDAAMLSIRKTNLASVESVTNLSIYVSTCNLEVFSF